MNRARLEELLGTPLASFQIRYLVTLGIVDPYGVRCPADRLLGTMHEFWISRGYACPGCGAAL